MPWAGRCAGWGGSACDSRALVGVRREGRVVSLVQEAGWRWVVTQDAGGTAAPSRWFAVVRDGVVILAVVLDTFDVAGVYGLGER